MAAPADGSSAALIINGQLFVLHPQRRASSPASLKGGKDDVVLPVIVIGQQALQGGFFGVGRRIRPGQLHFDGVQKLYDFPMLLAQSVAGVLQAAPDPLKKRGKHLFLFPLNPARDCGLELGEAFDRRGKIRCLERLKTVKRLADLLLFGATGNAQLTSNLRRGNL